MTLLIAKAKACAIGDVSRLSRRHLDAQLALTQ